MEHVSVCVYVRDKHHSNDFSKFPLTGLANISQHVTLGKGFKLTTKGKNKQKTAN